MLWCSAMFQSLWGPLDHFSSACILACLPPKDCVSGCMHALVGGERAGFFVVVCVLMKVINGRSQVDYDLRTEYLSELPREASLIIYSYKSYYKRDIS